MPNCRTGKTQQSATKSLLISVCDFEFIFGLYLLKVIVLNTDTLSRYLQGKNIDVVIAQKANSVNVVLNVCRNEDSFK